MISSWSSMETRSRSVVGTCVESNMARPRRFSLRHQNYLNRNKTLPATKVIFHNPKDDLQRVQHEHNRNSTTAQILLMAAWRVYLGRYENEFVSLVHGMEQYRFGTASIRRGAGFRGWCCLSASLYRGSPCTQNVKGSYNSAPNTVQLHISVAYIPTYWRPKSSTTDVASFRDQDHYVIVS